MERVLLDQIVETDYGQFDLVWAQNGGFDGNFDRFFAGQVNGLVGASDPDGVYINLARRSGGSPVRIVLISAPLTGGDASWEDVVEVSVVLPEAHERRWCTWAGETWGVLGALPPGSYRLRVSAEGRDQGHAGEFSEHPRRCISPSDVASTAAARRHFADWERGRALLAQGDWSSTVNSSLNFSWFSKRSGTWRTPVRLGALI